MLRFPSKGELVLVGAVASIVGFILLLVGPATLGVAIFVPGAIAFMLGMHV